MSSPKKNVAYIFYISLVDSSDTGSFRANPTIAAGDFKVSTDGGAFGNLATLPVVTPVGSIAVKVSLSAGEMNGDKIMVQAIDAAGAEWDDVLLFIDATTANVDDVALTSALSTHDGKLDTAQSDLDIITDSDGVILGDAGVDKVLDEVNTGATHNAVNSLGRQVRETREIGVYEGGQVWVDTIDGVAGTTDYENGTVDNPVDSMVDARILAVSLGIKKFRIAPSSNVTLAASFIGYEFNGNNWTLALGGQDITGSHFFGAEVSGTGIGTVSSDFHDCLLGACTLNQFHATHCGFDGVITVGVAGDYLLSHCFSAIAGATTPVIDVGAAIGNVNLAMPDWFNGIEIRNLNAAGTDNFSISGTGQIIYAASCSGIVQQRGDWKVTNTGGVTIVADDNTTNIASLLVDVSDLGIKKNATFSFCFLMVDATDHVTPETSLTVTGQRAIDSGAFGAITGSITEVSNGVYRLDGSAADSNGATITFRFSSAGAADTFVTIVTGP